MKKITNNLIVAGAVIACAFGIAGIIAAATQVNLGTVDNFSVIAGTAVINDDGPTILNGDLGLSPGSELTGFPPGVVNGTRHVAEAIAEQAKVDLTTAYNDAVAQTPVTTIPAELGRTTVTPGIYDSLEGYFRITGTLTLDAQGNPDAIFIFKAGSTLTTTGASHVTLINGAQACNIFWQLGDRAIIGTNSVFEGNVLALNSAVLSTGANVEGGIFALNGAVTLDSDTITKTYCALLPPPPAQVIQPIISPVISTQQTQSNSNGSNYFAPLPLINVTTIPNPLALPSGPGLVTYTYVVTNIGIVPTIGVWVKDNLCDDVRFISGDTNNDLSLDVGESWTYQCTKTVSQTETSTATAHGNANGWDGYDTANATVVVGVPLPPPLIHIVKTPDVFTLPFGGGAVTYTYIVTNPGTAPLSDVSVIDDKCTGLPGRVEGHPGDLNHNDLLESNEAWSFTCLTQLTQTTTNIGTAEGHANGLTAIDFAPVTVAVAAAPSFPSTGFSTVVRPAMSTGFKVISTGVASDNDSSAKWQNIILGWVLIIILASFFVWNVVWDNRGDDEA